MGRPRKIDKKRTAELCDLLTRGVPQATAARMVGISETALHNWKAHARKVLDAAGLEDSKQRGYTTRVADRDKPYVEFWESVENARAEAEVLMIDRVRQIAEGHGRDSLRAATWWLDRAHPDRWAQRQRVEVGGVEGGDVVIKIEYEPGDNEKEMPAA